MSQTQREQLDEELRAGDGLGGASIEESRAGFAAFMSGARVDDSVQVGETTLGGRRALALEPGPDGPVPARPGTILYLHGGANIVGSPETALSTATPLVARSGIRAISLDYRLAPEAPYPAGIEDVVSAYRELLESGVPAEEIVFAGDSAGGGQAVTGVLAAQDAGLPAPAAVVGFSPGLDQTLSGESMTAKLGIDPIFQDPDAFATFATVYLDGADPAQPLASPAIAGDLTGFPPVLLQVGEHERLLDDSTRFAARARDAGVDVILDVTAGVPHVFQSFWGRLDEADAALDRAAFFLRQRLGA